MKEQIMAQSKGETQKMIDLCQANNPDWKCGLNKSWRKIKCDHICFAGLHMQLYVFYAYLSQKGNDANKLSCCYIKPKIPYYF